MTHLTYLEAAVVGLIQGVSELFPVSSLGHNVLLPALVGGSWARDLNVAAPESPYLAFIVGLHVATAIALLIYFWRDWVRIIGGFFTSLGQFARPAPGTRRWQLQNANQRLAWMIIIATIPVGLTGLAFEKEFRIFFGVPVRAAIFLLINGLILLAGERFRRKASVRADQEIAHERELVAVGSVRRAGGARHAAGHQAGDEDDGNSRQKFAAFHPVHQHGVGDRAQHQERGVSEIHDGEILDAEVDQEEGIARVAAEHDAGHQQQVDEEANRDHRPFAGVDGRNFGEPPSDAGGCHRLVTRKPPGRTLRRAPSGASRS